MKQQKLVKMANEIGDYFAAEPNHTEAIDGIAGHLKRFWDPRMRTQLLECLDGEAASELQPLVREALLAHRATLAAHAE